MRRISTAVFASLALASVASAQTNVSPTLTASSTAGWYTDRYDPASFAVNNGVHGRNNVLQIGVGPTTDAANRLPGQQGSFYNTTGKKYDVLTSGSWSFQFDLYVENSWANSANGYVRTDIWATSVDASNAVSAYSIMGVTNYQGALRARGWDSNLGTWTDYAGLNVGAWNTFGMQFDIGTGAFSYLLNGITVGSFIEATSVGVHDVMAQVYNFNDPALGISGNPAYTANYSNTPATTVPEPSTCALMIAGLGALGVATRRRKQQLAS